MDPAAATLIESEFRAAVTTAKEASRALENDDLAGARDLVIKARECFMVSLLPVRGGRSLDGLSSLEVDRLDDMLRAIERVIEEKTSSRGTVMCQTVTVGVPG